MKGSIKFLALLTVACVLPQAVAGSAQHKQNSITRQENKTTWKWVNDGVRVEVTARGKVEFNDDYTDVVSISSDGSLRVEDDRGGMSRRLEIAPSGDGGLKRSYFVGGEARPYDDRARAWLADVLAEAVRHGFDARARAQKILRRQGPDGLLGEVSRLKGDYVRKVYLQEMLRSENLSGDAVQKALRFASHEISSDYEKAQILLQVSETRLADDAIRAVYLEAVGTVRSDYEKGRVLSALLNEKDLSKDALMLALKVTADISSDYEKAKVLVKIAENFPGDEAVRAAYVEAVGGIKSDYERGRVLSALLKQSELQKETLMLTLKTAAGMSSDYEKAKVLMKVAAVSSSDETVRAALIEAAQTINSEYERGRVLNAVFKPKN